MKNMFISTRTSSESYKVTSNTSKMFNMKKVILVAITSVMISIVANLVLGVPQIEALKHRAQFAPLDQIDQRQNPGETFKSLGVTPKTKLPTTTQQSARKSSQLNEEQETKLRLVSSSSEEPNSRDQTETTTVSATTTTTITSQTYSTPATSESSKSKLGTHHSPLNNSTGAPTSTLAASSTLPAATELPLPSSSTSSSLSTTASTASRSKSSATSPLDTKRRPIVSVRRHQQPKRTEPTDVLDQMSTVQSVSFAEPNMAASNQHEHRHQQQEPTSTSSNRWTHFGARLKPLGTGDHHVAAANSKSLAMAPSVRQPPRAKEFSTNSLASANNNADDEEDLDDDQDSEALLYKMMQQQTFLMNPSWQQEQEAKPQPSSSTFGQTQAIQGSQVNQRASGHSGDQRSQVEGANPSMELGNNNNSKKVIKLLKSYSHIHQVDDSDDQIRGSYTRIKQRPPALNSIGQPQVTSSQRSPQRQQHIFVSSQPMTRAYSAPNSQQQDQYQGDNNQVDDSRQSSPSASDEESDLNSPVSSGQEEDEFECPNNGIFADVASGCQSYHVCQSGAQVQQKFQCPLGTLFNDIILTCDFAHNVQCKGNPKQPQQTQAANGYHEAEQVQPMARPSVHHDQGSHGRVNQAPPRVASQQQANRWSQQQTPTGPRHLQIGTNYNRHQQVHESSQARAVNSYPVAKVDTDQDSDDGPLVPLVSTTTSPKFTPVTSHQLPYHSPPVPLVQRYQTPNNQQRAPMGNQRQRQSYLDNQNFMGPAGGFDGASSASPVFASHDDPPARVGQRISTEANSILGTTSSPTSTSTITTTPSTTLPNKTMAHSFNLVINHTTPTRQVQQQYPSGTQASQNIKPRVNHQSTTQVNQAKEFNLKDKSNREPSSGDIGNLQYPSQFSSATAVHGDSQFQQSKHQINRINIQRNSNIVNNNKHLSESSQGKLNHLNKEIPQSSSESRSSSYLKGIHKSPTTRQQTLVDLTNDKRAGVSSEAINDGLLLIVRHSSNSSPIQVTSGDGQQTNKLSRSASKSQAFVVDPNSVRLDSVEDAQLFPNVQRVLAAAQTEPVVSHQSPVTTPKFNHPQIRGADHQAVSTQQVHHHESPNLTADYNIDQNQELSSMVDIERSMLAAPSTQSVRSTDTNNQESRRQLKSRSPNQAPETTKPQKITVATKKVSNPKKLKSPEIQTRTKAPPSTTSTTTSTSTTLATSTVSS